MLGPELYYEVRYEALATQPEAECRALCEFLGVPFDEAMLRHHEGKVRTDPRAGVKNPSLPLPITPDLRNWRSQMPEHVERFEAVAGDLLDELSYSRSTQRVAPKILEEEDAIRSQFEGRPLPRRWGNARARAVAMTEAEGAHA